MLTAFFPHFPALVLVLTTAIVITLGAAAQLLAARLKVPAMLFLLGLGIALGPDGLGIVQPEIYGVGLRAITAIAVAVIVFEGAMLIDVRQLRHCSRSVLGLITVGAFTTFALGALTAHYVAGLPWKIASLFGAMVSVTGPTVIGPILKRLPLSHRLKTTLEAESVLVDAVGVLLTASAFSYLTGSAGGIAGGVIQLVTNLATGIAIGAGSALLLREALARLGALASEHVRVVVFGAVLLAYSLAEAIAHESGITAVAVAGLMIGSISLPEKESIKRFKGDLTLIALSLVFILLAAGMPVHRLSALGWQGVATVLILMLVVRPLAVVLATWGTALTWGEKAFIAWLGPRGIVAASMASLMALELNAWGIAGGESLGALVFLTVLLTVSIEGSGARWIATRLNVMPKKVIIVGGDEVARKLGQQLREAGEAVTLIDTDPVQVAAAAALDIEGLRGDAVDPSVLSRAGLAWCHTVVLATPSDKANMLIAQAVRAQEPKVRMIARLTDAKNEAAFRGSQVETLLMGDASALILSALITRPTVLPLLTATGDGDLLVETRVGNPKATERSLKALDLPKDCLVALVKRNGSVRVPNGDSTLKLGDAVTLIGMADAVNRTRSLLESDT